MMRVLKAVVTPLILFSIIFSPVFTQKAQAFCVLGVGSTCVEKDSSGEAEKKFNEQLEGNFNDLAVKSCPIRWSEISIEEILKSALGLLGANVIISGLNGAPFVGGLVEPFDDALDQLNSAWLSALTWGFAASLATYISAYLIQVGFVLNSHITTDNPVIQTGFNVTLSVVNVFFVILLVVIGIMTILRRSGWTAQKKLGNLIVAIILINFSIFFANILLNISNVFTSALLGNACAGELFNKLNLVNIFNIIQPVIGGNPLNPLTSTAALVISSLFTVISALTLFAIFLFLVIRYVAIVILLVFMPIAWLGFVAPEIKIPGLGNPWSKWWEEFMRWITVGPIMSFSLYLTISILQNMGKAIDTSLGTTNAAGADPLLNILNIFAALIMSTIGIFIAIKGSGLAGTLIAGGLAAGTAFATRGIQSLGGRIGFGGQIRAEEKAKQLHKQAEEAERAGQTGKARSLRVKAAAAEKLAAGAGAVGKGTAIAPTGLGFGLGGKLLEQAGVKGIKPSGEIRTAEAWREAEVKKTAARYAGMSEDQRKQEIKKISGELDGITPPLPGRKVELYNRYAAIAQSMAKEGKLDEEMTRRVLRSDFQRQASLMGVKIDLEETAKKLPADQLVSRLKTLNAIKSEKGMDSEAAGKMQVEALRRLESSRKLDAISDPELMRAAYSLKEGIEKKGGDFKNYELAFGMNESTGKVVLDLANADSERQTAQSKVSEVNRSIQDSILEQQSLQQRVATSAPEAQGELMRQLQQETAREQQLRQRLPELNNELGRADQAVSSAEAAVRSQMADWNKWIAGLGDGEVRKLPLDKIFGGKLIDNLDPRESAIIKEGFVNAAIRRSPADVTKFTNVRSENYEAAARAVNEGLDRAIGDPANAADQTLLGALNLSKRLLSKSATRRGISL